MVRGLDYYTGLVWEIYDTGNTSVGAIGGGGKYSSLREQIGGPKREGIGFSLGVERVLLSLTEERRNELVPGNNVSVFRIDLRRNGLALKIADQLRKDGFSVSIASFGKGMGGCFKRADRLGAKKVLILDSDQTLKIKDRSTREQVEVKEEEVVSLLEKR